MTTTTRIVGRFRCLSGHEFETVQSPIVALHCQEEDCPHTAKRVATQLEPLPLVSIAAVKAALAKVQNFDYASETPAGRMIHELRDLLTESLRVIEAFSPVPQEPAASLPTRLDNLHAAGWMVVCHNDYWQNGVRMTFWSFARGSEYIKGEGASSEAALTECETAAAVLERR